MDPTLEAEIIDRGVRERERGGCPPDFPPLTPVPAARYTDHDFAALERRFVFGSTWLFVAHVDELPDPGDYVLLRQFDEPLMLLRGADHVVRAFYNTCQHRGGPLVREESGSTGQRLVCPYHAWTYDLEGALVGVPSAADFPALDKACRSLRPVRCETWGPLVFINLDPDGEPLADGLGVVGRDLGPQVGDGPEVGPVRLIARRTIEVEGNWKLTVDANIETYHVNVVHKNTAALLLDQRATGIFLLPRGHSRMLVHNRDDMTFPIDLPGFPAASKLAHYGIYSYHLFPNTSLVFGGTPAILFAISSWPLGPDRSVYDVHFMAPVDPAGEHADMLAMLVEANWNVLQEDLANLPFMQRSMRCGGLESIPLSYQERRLYHQHEELDRRIGPDRIDPKLRVPAVLAPYIED